MCSTHCLYQSPTKFCFTLLHWWALNHTSSKQNMHFSCVDLGRMFADCVNIDLLLWRQKFYIIHKDLRKIKQILNWRNPVKFYIGKGRREKGRGRCNFITQILLSQKKYEPAKCLQKKNEILNLKWTTFGFESRNDLDIPQLSPYICPKPVQTGPWTYFWKNKNKKNIL